MNVVKPICSAARKTRTTTGIFPEPDLLPMTFTDTDIADIRKGLPELPEQKRARFVATG